MYTLIKILNEKNEKKYWNFFIVSETGYYLPIKCSLDDDKARLNLFRSALTMTKEQFVTYTTNLRGAK